MLVENNGTSGYPESSLVEDFLGGNEDSPEFWENSTAFRLQSQCYVESVLSSLWDICFEELSTVVLSYSLTMNCSLMVGLRSVILPFDFDADLSGLLDNVLLDDRRSSDILFGISIPCQVR